MKKPSVSKKIDHPGQNEAARPHPLLTEVRQLIQSARRAVSTVVDTFQVATGFDIGRRIVKREQGKVPSTKSRLPLELAYYQEFRLHGDATKRDTYLKTA